MPGQDADPVGSASDEDAQQDGEAALTAVEGDEANTLLAALRSHEEDGVPAESPSQLLASGQRQAWGAST